MTGVSETIPAYTLNIPRPARGIAPVIADSPIIASPISTLDLPEPVCRWLADAGISTRVLDRAEVRRGQASASGRTSLLLYDSRNASDRIDAETAVALGYKTIDAARLLAGHLQTRTDHTILMSADPRRRFLDALRPEIETLGATWLRLADYPHPYRGAICRQASPAIQDRLLKDPATARLVHAITEISGAVGRASGVAVEECLRTCQEIGQPVSIAAPLDTDRATRGIGAAMAPLTWETTLETFAAWWRYRGTISLAATQQDRAMDLSIERHGPAGSEPWTPAVEIWRGRHVAILPLREGAMTIRDLSLPYQHAPFRHHAGFTADEAGFDLSRPLIPLFSAAS